MKYIAYHLHLWFLGAFFIGGIIFFVAQQSPLLAGIVAFVSAVIFITIFQRTKKRALYGLFGSLKKIEEQDGYTLADSIKSFWFVFPEKSKIAYANFLKDKANHTTLSTLILSKPYFLGQAYIQLFYTAWESKVIRSIKEVDTIDKKIVQFTNILDDYEELKIGNVWYKNEYIATRYLFQATADELLKKITHEFEKFEKQPEDVPQRQLLFVTYFSFIELLSRFSGFNEIFQKQFLQTGKVLYREEVECIARAFVFSVETNNILLNLLTSKKKKQQVNL